MCHHVHTEIRGQPTETGSPFYHGLQGSNLGHQRWQQVPELLSYLRDPLQDSCHGVSGLPPGCSLSVHCPPPEFTA